MKSIAAHTKQVVSTSASAAGNELIVFNSRVRHARHPTHTDVHSHTSPARNPKGQNKNKLIRIYNICIFFNRNVLRNFSTRSIAVTKSIRLAVKIVARITDPPAGRIDPGRYFRKFERFFFSGLFLRAIRIARMYSYERVSARRIVNRCCIKFRLTYDPMVRGISVKIQI